MHQPGAVKQLIHTYNSLYSDSMLTKQVYDLAFCISVVQSILLLSKKLRVQTHWGPQFFDSLPFHFLFLFCNSLTLES